jgi:hypothetical protein
LAIISATIGGRSVGKIRSRTLATEFSFSSRIQGLFRVALEDFPSAATTHHQSLFQKVL